MTGDSGRDSGIAHGESVARSDQDLASYAGRWVARLHGRIVAQGGTPQQALRAAQVSRHKEKPEIGFMPADVVILPLLSKVRRVFHASQELYLVGGAVRDMLLGRVSGDLDFAVPSSGVASARRVANALQADFVVLDNERDTGRAILTAEDGTRTYLDFAGVRGNNIDADLRARDFTINALAYDLRNDSILDPLEGAVDLRAKRIRACSRTAFMEDPVRVLRAVRLAASLGFSIEAGTRQLMKQVAGELSRVSPERQRDELFRILAGPKPEAAIRALELLGVLDNLLPELKLTRGVAQPLPHVQDVWMHTLAVVRSLESILEALRVDDRAENANDLFTGLLSLSLGRYREAFARHFGRALTADRQLRGILFFAALFHDVAKPLTRSADESGRIRFLGHDEQGATIAAERAQSLHLSNEEKERIRIVILHHMRFHFHVSRMEGERKLPSRRAIYRFFRDAGEAGVDLVLLGLADLQGTRDHTLSQDTWAAGLDVARILLENYWDRPEEIVAPPRLVDGHELMAEFGLEPGPRVGDLLEAIREGQAVGRIGDRLQALDVARAWLAEHGRS